MTRPNLLLLCQLFCLPTIPIIPINLQAVDAVILVWDLILNACFFDSCIDTLKHCLYDYFVTYNLTIYCPLHLQ